MPMTRCAMGKNWIGQWQRTFGRHIWFLRRAGITSKQIEQEIARNLRRCIKVRELTVPAADERNYPRILTHWQHDSAYLDHSGRPRTLRFDGHSPTFRSLVRASVPGANASRALDTLKRYLSMTTFLDGDSACGGQFS